MSIVTAAFLDPIYMKLSSLGLGFTPTISHVVEIPNANTFLGLSREILILDYLDAEDLHATAQLTRHLSDARHFTRHGLTFGST